MNLFTALKHDFSVYVTKKYYESSDKQISLISIETEIVSIQIVNSSNENAQQLKGKFTRR